MRDVHLLVPPDLDDPGRASGGNVYGQRVRAGLREAGWTVHEHHADPAEVPDAAVVLVDGLVAERAPEDVAALGRRSRVVLLLHVPDGGPGEAAVLDTARAVVTTSPWARRRVLERQALPAAALHVAPPGVDPAEAATAGADGGRLLCVAALTPGKGHDVLLAALARLDDLAWTCTLVGGTGRDPAHARRVAELASGLPVRVTGSLTGAELAASYASSDLLVHPSRAESYGMVVTEALARGLPVVTTTAGALPETLGRLPDGSVPGLLVPPDDPDALADALRRWLTDADLRARLRTAALARRATLDGWDRTVRVIAHVLEEVAA